MADRYPSHYELPNVCCVCLEPAAAYALITKTWNMATFSVTQQLNVPMCSRHHQRYKRGRVHGLIAGTVVFLLGVLLLVVLIRSNASTIWKWVTLGAALLGPKLAYHVFAGSKPVLLEYEQRPFFPNTEYQRLFKEANKLPY